MSEQVHRVCRAIHGECKGCPEYITGMQGARYYRGCYQHAAEVINTVETGNPWPTNSRTLKPASRNSSSKSPKGPVLRPVTIGG